MIKKLFIVCLIALLWVTGAWADAGFIGEVGQTPASATYCASCPDTSAGADVACEDWENTGARCTWADTTGADGAISHAATHAGTWDTITNKGLKCLQITNSNATHTFTVFDMGAGKTNPFFNYFLLVDSEGLASGQFFEVFRLSSNSDGGGASVLYLKVYDNAGTIELRISYLNDTPAWEEVTLQSISLDNDYKVEIDWQSGTHLIVDINDTNRLNDTTNIYTQTGQRYYLFGDTSYAPTLTSVFQVDNVKVDDDTAP